VGTQANAWDIYDAEMGRSERIAAASGTVLVDGVYPDVGGGGPAPGGGSSAFGHTSGEGSSLSGSGVQHGSSFLDPSASETLSAVPDATGTAVGEKKTATEGATPEVSLRSLNNLPSALRTLERIVTQNSYHDQHLAYRNIMQTPAAATGTVPAAGLKYLWGYQCEASEGRNVSCVEWNPENPDMLTVAYGEFNFSHQKDGLILFWSLKNPSFPDKMISTPCGVTCIAFSSHHPNLLAAGLYDGTVCIYDVRKKDEEKPMLESGHTNGKHTDPVWGLKWVDQGADKGEVLVSISTDGRVTQWNMKKGLENQDLMVLKRVTAAAKQSDAKGGAVTAGSEGIISRRASGLCFDFCPKDPNIYVAGTEEGHLHKCSCSYNEQSLDNFFGHAGPVYKLRWSPFCPNTFISCSADWSVKLWNQEHSSPYFSFQSTTDYVADICWSPDNSTIFASVTGDGRVDVWDLSANTLDPVKTVETDRPLSCVSFARSSPVLVTGNDQGVVEVYQLTGVLAEPVERTAAQQVEALDKVTSTH